jgi:hypothetical protein
MLAVGVTVFFVLIAVLTWSPAPAVSISVGIGLLSGSITFVISGSDGPHGVPLDVAIGFSLGATLGALVGFIVTRRRRRGTWPMRRAALWLLVASPLLVTMLLLTALDACPLYDERTRAGYCHNSVDVLGDWISGVTVLFAFDLLVWIVLLWIAPGKVGRLQAEQGGTPGGREDMATAHRSRTIVRSGAIAIGLLGAGLWMFPPTPDVVGMRPRRAFTALSAAGFDAEWGHLWASPEPGRNGCDVIERARETRPRGPDRCVLAQEPKLGFLGRAARGTAITLYFGESSDRPDSA